MGDWNRSTRAYSLQDLAPEAQQAMKAHIEAYQLGPILDDPLLCIETASIRKKKGLFGGPGKPVVVSVVLTRRWLIWAVKDEQGTTSALSAQLKDVVATDYAQTPAYRLMPDTGLDITGVFTGRTQPEGRDVSMFIGLGDEAVVQKFKERLLRALQEAKG